MSDKTKAIVIHTIPVNERLSNCSSIGSRI